MEGDLEYKQNYLRTEIIDQGYDPENFSKFLSQEKGDIGLDLNNWTFEELKETVSKFKSINHNPENNQSTENNKNTENNQNIENNQNTENNQTIENTENIKNNQNMNILSGEENINDLEKQNSIKEVNEHIICIKQEKNEFTDIENFKIIVSK